MASPEEDANSPPSAVSPSWAPPRAPLPPHKLAKLANALGVSTPVPVLHGFLSPSSPFMASPILPSPAFSPSFDFRRSPTPSAASSAHTYTPASQTSRFLLHVVPPSHLPHESQFTQDNELLAPPPNASGYHAQFRRGVLVPVYPTLHSQIAAIAKEYALPSTVGIVLYLINNTPSANAGMRLGQQLKRRESRDLGYRRIFGDTSGCASSELNAKTTRFWAHGPTAWALAPPPRLDSPDSATSVSDSGDISLPGLNGSSLIPILAKVEFDIDKRKATWYGRWKKTRRAQAAKRAESRLGGRSRAGSTAGDESAVEGEDGDRKPALELRLVERLREEANTPAYLRSKDGRLLPPGSDDGYAQLADSDEEDDEEATMKFDNGSRRNNPDIVDLALSGAQLTALEDEDKDEEDGDDVDEVAELLKGNSRPQLSVAIPGESPPRKERSGSITSSLSRKHIPPALDLAPSLPNAVQIAAPGTGGDNFGLAYLTEESTPSTGSLDDVDEETGKPRRSPLEEKRDGQFFDDLNLGLDPSLEFDDDDPDDRRKSQVLMSSRLDEIERALAQFSPRKLAIEDLAAESPTGMPSMASLSPTPNSRIKGAPTPRPSPQPGAPTEGASWPAIPYSTLNNMSSPDQQADGLPSPPRIAFNGISTELPKSPFQQRFSTHNSDESDETLARKRELAEQDALYPPLMAPSLLRPGSDSPVIPLSPDPFGRFPSEYDTTPPRLDHSPGLKQGSALRPQGSHGKTLSNISETPSSSRFSVDSLSTTENHKAGQEEGGRSSKSNSIISVKSIKKLWRRTNKASVQGSATPSPSLPESGRASPNSAPLTSDSGLVPGTTGLPSRPPSRSPLLDQQMLGPQRKSSQHQMQWNSQEPPYPGRQPSPAAYPLPTTPTPPPPASAPAAPTQAAVPSDQKSNVRKSILKSFKSQGGHSSHASSSSISVGRTSNERKSGVVELNSVMKRASGVSSTMTLVELPRASSATLMYESPRSPPLPEMPRSSSATLYEAPRSPPFPDRRSNYSTHSYSTSHSRSASRQSQVSVSSQNALARVRQKRPSTSSTESLSRAPSARLAVGSTSPPRKGVLSGLQVPRTSGESSYEDRPSFDESQFEIVSPKHAPAHMLSYPYNTMDQSMSSME
ncbi:uncharacterized protein BXZ73DRAFT_104735 [Epithele typhae]|uniref:uncharacterized protein n=1 Tax=Epithele typhae TaxID=378194 RepID=UPI00200816F0|nr:uncharacterized protein BXZ73DRAFT_104735 [Epithele typhae]KAH9920222.1 hypothetical protein BXZ73DRAFT_104735 [Epithele typhae]